MTVAVTVVGVDCATDPRRVGLALGTFDRGRVEVGEVRVGTRTAPPGEVVAGWVHSARDPVLLALDAPLGWPAPLGDALGAHRAGEALRVGAHALFRRSTDRFVRERIGKQSLDVGADRIARTAHAALALLGGLRRHLGVELPLAWGPQVEGVSAIEVYPAATLRAHGIDARGYKARGEAGDAARSAVADALAARVGLGEERGVIRGSDDALDAVVCLLAAQDFLQGEAMPPPDPALARREGWIWVRGVPLSS